MPSRTHTAWSGPWREGDWLGSSAGFLCLSGSSPAPSRGPLPPASPVLPLASFLCPRDPHGLEGSLEGVYRLGSSAGSRARVGHASTLRSSPALLGGSLLPASPDLPGLKGTDSVWPPLLLPPQSPYILLVHFEVPPISLGIRVPHQRPAGALVVGRH